MRDSDSASSTLRLPYMSGLDGVRAISVLAVFFYHANFPWAVGGFLGVESFFAISGYLITSLLLREVRATQELSLARFWLRRARRLLPALLLLLVAVVPLAWRLAPDALPRLREDIPGALLYVTNWVYIVREVPYFEGFGRPPLLQHLWSLAVEEQFYLVWPLALWAFLRILRARKARLLPWLTTFCLIGVGLSSGLMAILYDPQADPSRVYYGTDTRAAGFLLGAGLAAVWKPGARTGRKTRLLEWAGFGGLLGLLCLFGGLHEYAPLLYRGGFVLTSLVTCLVVLAVSDTRTRLAGIMGWAPLRWIGTRSYGIYLWHWPLMVATSWGRASALPSNLLVGLQLVATILLAELSYQWVEQPIRQRGLRAWWQGSTRLAGKFRLNAASGISMLVLAGVMVVRPSSGALAQASSAAPSAADEALSLQITAPTVSPTRIPVSPARSPVIGGAPTETVEFPELAAQDIPGEAQPPEPSAEKANPLRITFIGDSIMESTAPWLEQTFATGSYYLDAVRKRRMDDALDIIPVLAAEGHLGATAVIHLGTNVPFEAAVFDRVMASLLEHGVRRVLFLNMRRPVAWEAVVNHQLAEGVSRWPQAELIDWYRLSKPHPGWLSEDAVHPTYAGAEAYVQAIWEALGGDF